MDNEELGRMPLFADVAAAELAPWAERFDEVVVLSGTGLAKQDDYAYRFYVVLEGEVDVDREFAPVARLGAGDFFGESGLVTTGRRNARIVAHTHCRLACLMLWDFRAMLEALPAVAARIEQEVAARSPSPTGRDAD